MSRHTALALILGLTVVVYAPTWRAGFVYEDIRTVISNGVVQQTEPWHGHQLRSLSALTFRLNHALDGNNPRGYHAVNVAVHVVNGALVYALGAALLEPAAALVAAMIFCLAPLQSEAVAYVSGRTELLAALCVLGAAVLVTRPWRRWMAAAVPLLLLAGLLTKETAAVGFALVPLVIWTQHPPCRRLRWPVWRAGVAAMPVTVCAVWLLQPLRFVDQGFIGSERGIVPYAATQALAFWRYLLNIAVPYGLTIDHDWDLVSHPLAYVALVALLGVGVVAIRRWRTHRVQGLALAWVLIALAPRLLVRIPEYLNEHQLYLPMVGVSLLIAALVTEWQDARV